MASFLESMITKVQIKTAYGPDLVLNKPFAPSPPGTNPVAAALKPRVEVFVSGAAEPLVMQPYGKPPPTKWPTIVAVGGATVGLLLILSTIGASTVVKRRRGLAGLGGRNKFVPSGRVQEHLDPAKLDRTSTRMVGWDTEIKVWPSRKAMAKAIRRQQMNPASRDDWTPMRSLSPGEGFDGLRRRR